LWLALSPLPNFAAQPPRVAAAFRLLPFVWHGHFHGVAPRSALLSLRGRDRGLPPAVHSGGKLNRNDARMLAPSGFG